MVVVKLAVPDVVIAPVCVIAPLLEMILKLPTLDVASDVATVFVTEAATLFDNVIAPDKLLLKFKVIALAPAVKLDVPDTVNAPVCVIAPLLEVMLKLPTLDAANDVAILLVKDTVLALPVLVKLMAPVKLLLEPKVIAKPPVVKLDVPGIVNTPDWVIAPPAVIDRLPEFVSVTAGSAIAALLKINVR